MTVDRALGPEMTADGWVVIGGDYMVWMHAPSGRVVSLDGPVPRCQCAVPAYGEEPDDTSALGYVVALRRHADDGNPLTGEAFWVASYSLAIRLAIRTRASVLRERKDARK